jgi:hypothetical protein
VTYQNCMSSLLGKQVTVYIYAVFLKIDQIDTVKQTFTGDLFVQARWREPEFDGQSDLVCIIISSLTINQQLSIVYTVVFLNLFFLTLA